jgi:LPS-assembly protein
VARKTVIPTRLRCASFVRRDPVFAPAAVAWACVCVAASPAWAQTSPRPRTDPVVLEAESMDLRLDREAEARGDVELRQGDLKLRADLLRFTPARDELHAIGNVRIDRAGDRYWGPELTLDVERYAGEFIAPHYWLARTGAGGSASRAEFIDRSRSRLYDATYTSCPIDNGEEPDWVLKADSVSVDMERNEGVAEGAVLRFLGVPILGLPHMSFPVTGERKSGWLPPNVNLDSRSGFEVSVPYYWNVLPNLDTTITPIVSNRRGFAVANELRYLTEKHVGSLRTTLLPDDRVERETRYSFDLQHESRFDARTTVLANIQRVSDDNYWKDFARSLPSITQRLLPQDVLLLRRYDRLDNDLDVYARLQRWQVLQAADPDGIAPPFQRRPQVGIRATGRFFDAWHYSAETEVNRFSLPDALPLPAGVQPGSGGARWHLLAGIERRFGASGWWVVPRASLNSAYYETDEAMRDGRRSGGRTIPTFSVDGGLLFERDAKLFGRAVRQTLEPRLLYVKTPYRDQSTLPNFDSAAKDFNFVSIFSRNIFSGVDWVSDANEITAGATSRFLDAKSGAELLRLGLAQRYVFNSQRILPDCPPDAQNTDECLRTERRLSDLLLLGSSRLWPAWVLDGTVEYNPSTNRSVRSVLSARYNPEPFHTVALTYRYARGLSEQFELGWQWPIYRREPTSVAAAAGGAPCKGTLYGVGRVNYSTLESRLTDSIVGLEYDAGCWIGRIVGERLSTGRSEATTRLMIQLELVGLSRLGSNPLATLIDNVPGYRLLRDDDKPADRAPITP